MSFKCLTPRTAAPLFDHPFIIWQSTDLKVPIFPTRWPNRDKSLSFRDVFVSLCVAGRILRLLSPTGNVVTALTARCPSRQQHYCNVVVSRYSHENDVICIAKYPPGGGGGRSGRRLYESQVPLQTWNIQVRINVQVAQKFIQLLRGSYSLALQMSAT
jgi:hypothetical protein